MQSSRGLGSENMEKEQCTAEQLFPEAFKKPAKLWQEGDILIGLKECTFLYYFIQEGTMVKVSKAYPDGTMFVHLHYATKYEGQTRKIMEHKEYRVDGRFFRKARRLEISRKITEEI